MGAIYPAWRGGVRWSLRKWAQGKALPLGKPARDPAWACLPGHSSRKGPDWGTKRGSPQCPGSTLGSTSRGRASTSGVPALLSTQEITSQIRARLGAPGTGKAKLEGFRSWGEGGCSAWRRVRCGEKATAASSTCEGVIEKLEFLTVVQSGRSRIYTWEDQTGYKEWLFLHEENQTLEVVQSPPFDISKTCLVWPPSWPWMGAWIRDILRSLPIWMILWKWQIGRISGGHQDILAKIQLSS